MNTGHSSAGVCPAAPPEQPGAGRIPGAGPAPGPDPEVEGLDVPKAEDEWDPESYRCLNCGCPLPNPVVVLLADAHLALVCSPACEAQLLSTQGTEGAP